MGRRVKRRAAAIARPRGRAAARAVADAEREGFNRGTLYGERRAWRDHAGVHVVEVYGPDAHYAHGLRGRIARAEREVAAVRHLVIRRQNMQAAAERFLAPPDDGGDEG